MKEGRKEGRKEDGMKEEDGGRRTEGRRTEDDGRWKPCVSNEVNEGQRYKRSLVISTVASSFLTLRCNSSLSSPPSSVPSASAPGRYLMSPWRNVESCSMSYSSFMSSSFLHTRRGRRDRRDRRARRGFAAAGEKEGRVGVEGQGRRWRRIVCHEGSERRAGEGRDRQAKGVERKEVSL